MTNGGQNVQDLAELSWWIVYIGIPLVGALFTVDAFIHRSAEAKHDKLVAEKDSEIAALHVRVNGTNKELYDYKVNSAQLFATIGALSETRREMMGSLGRIEDKLDRLVERGVHLDRA